MRVADAEPGLIAVYDWRPVEILRRISERRTLRVEVRYLDVDIDALLTVYAKDLDPADSFRPGRRNRWRIDWALRRAEAASLLAAWLDAHPPEPGP